MEHEYRISIIVPAYNSEKNIEECLKSICNESKNFECEIIVIDDGSIDKTSEIVKKFKTIKLIKLKKNKGVGYVRNLGARLARYKILCYIDSDLIILKNSILNLVKRLYQNKNVGAVSGIQETINLNLESWSSNFVCLKSCYGLEEIEKETELQACASDFCVISKELLKQAGGWKTLRSAGGEEFYLGYQINQLNKKNIRIKDASYKAFFVSLYSRFKRIIDRTEKYIHILLVKKKFDPRGSFATSNQAFSCLMTLLFLVLILFSFNLNKSFIIFGLLILFIFQIIIEYKFLIFAKKHFGLKMLFFSLFGIQVVNIGILFGVIYFFLQIFRLKKLR